MKCQSLGVFDSPAGDSLPDNLLKFRRKGIIKVLMFIVSNRQPGFTIVELLIVIVVIGILAAITIVAFNGVQNRAKLSSAQAASNAILKKAILANSLSSSYPSVAGDFAANPETVVAGKGISILSAAPTAANGTNGVFYQACTTGGPGVRINYFDYVANTATAKYVYAGNGSTCSAFATAFTVAG